jgi:hypothetical protein
MGRPDCELNRDLFVAARADEQLLPLPGGLSDDVLKLAIP